MVCLATSGCAAGLNYKSTLPHLRRPSSHVHSQRAPSTGLFTRTLNDLHYGVKRDTRCNFLFRNKQQSTGPTSARNELVDALLTKGASFAELSKLVDEVCSGSMRIDPKKLGGGPWVVVYTKGPPQPWSLTYDPAKALKGGNRASQDFNPVTREAVNKAEYLGGDLYVTASGTFEAVDESNVTPKSFKVGIQEGCLHAWGLNIPLPIRGTGVFQVLYLDDTIRIFRSQGSYAVQVRADKLP